MPRADPEFSTGGVVLDAEEHPGCCIVIVPTRRAADGSKVLALPKGHPDAGESIEAAALREVREEAGVTCEIREELGEVKYFYQRSGRRIAKVVRFFLMDYQGGDVADHDHEVEACRWLPLADAAEQLSYPGERQIVQKALDRT